jgi:hypothetical protein
MAWPRGDFTNQAERILRNYIFHGRPSATYSTLVAEATEGTRTVITMMMMNE